MRLILQVLLAFTIAAGLGLGATWWSLTQASPPFGALAIGPWRAAPDVGGLGADPYLRARIARSGEAPLAYGDGLSFDATTDDAGRPLDAACDYRLEGDLPAARLWTLAAFTPTGGRLANPLGRFATSSAETVRMAGRPIVIELARDARPGDWLPLGGEGPFTLRLSLYDTALGTPLARAAPTALLAIIRGGCR
ncbi:DUF1214 domain-containing protein [Methylopila henanensis]|uniref:DUF1214 domain-containing protein n=1 Tax=Methylopila henanensis TaxID=873516 RepID=A0ABW4KE58_9HYPH